MQRATLSNNQPAARRSLPSVLTKLLRFIRQGSLVSKAIPSVLDQAIVSGTSFVTSILLGRLCAPGEIGVYFLGLSLVMYAVAIQSEIICGPYTVYSHRREGRALASYTGSMMVHQAIFSLLVIGAFGLLAGIVALGWGPHEMLPALLVLMGAAPLLLLRTLVRMMSMAHLRMREVLLIDVTVAGLQLSGLALLAWCDYLSVVTVFLVMAGACVVAATGWFWLRPLAMRFEASRIWTDWRQNWQLSRWALLSEMFGSTTPYLLPWMLALAHGTAATGLFAICTTLVGLSNSFLLGMSNFLVPRCAQALNEGGLARLQTVLRQSLMLIVSALGMLAIMFFLAGEWIAVTLYGENYAGCGATITVLAVGLLFNGLNVGVGNTLYAMERQQANVAADITILVVTLLAAVMLIAPYGVLGTALATLAGTVAGTAVRSVAIVRFFGQQADPLICGEAAR